MLPNFVYLKMIPTTIVMYIILSDYIYLIHPRRPFSLGQMNIIVIFFTINLTRTVSNLFIKILHYISEAVHITRCNKKKSSLRVLGMHYHVVISVMEFLFCFHFKEFILRHRHICVICTWKNPGQILNGNGIFQLSVASLGPLTTLTFHKAG